MAKKTVKKKVATKKRSAAQVSVLAKDYNPIPPEVEVSPLDWQTTPLVDNSRWPFAAKFYAAVLLGFVVIVVIVAANS